MKKKKDSKNINQKKSENNNFAFRLVVTLGLVLLLILFITYINVNNSTNFNSSNFGESYCESLNGKYSLEQSMIGFIQVRNSYCSIKDEEFWIDYKIIERDGELGLKKNE